MQDSLIWHKCMIRMWAVIRADARRYIKHHNTLNINFRNAAHKLRESRRQLKHHRAAYARLAKSQKQH